jgi:membrane protein DedA with SNARE-associated domain
MSWLPFDGSALAVSAGIVVLSFVSEDAAAVSSALLVLGGPVAWPVGFASCFLGIWVGDLGIYSATRWGGKPFLRGAWLARRTKARTLGRLEEKFRRNATATLFASRFLPGTRVATSIAAGLSSISFGRFAAVTGFAVLVWVAAIFGLTRSFGAQALVWLGFAENKIAAAVFTALVVLAVMLLAKRLESRAQCWRVARLRVLHWEFWPGWLFYLPVGAYYAWLAVRFRSFSLPSAANPGIPTGGLVGESKYAILDALRRLDPGFVADAYPINGRTATDRMLSLHRTLCEESITLPFILKPDVGQRGAGVKLIRSLRAALQYLEQVEAPVIVQRYAAGPHEVGVFYYRFPNEAQGRIFAITEKIFPCLTGDGKRTVEELITADPRASIIAKRYLQRFAHRRSEVLAAGEELKLVESGNHAQGCIFRDGRRLWTPELEEAIDRLSRIPGFFVGRYDIRYSSEKDLQHGRNLQVVELNGAASEATNIYDARNSLGVAYRTLFEQWRLVFRIGAANRARGIAPCSLATLGREWRKYCRAASFYPIAD